MYLIEKKYLLGCCNTLIGVSFIGLSITYYKRSNKSNHIEVPDTVLKNMNIELKSLIAEDKKIKAIKKYRMVTGVGLKEANEYIDLLSKENLN
ncbi:ribosomal protein L7/L12 [Oceanirhabdus seepicola]|uniref:Ribosomal protein L7/L12 n=2 Tax=Oceanirhabdus seepicola TaxID=2828781 RepID=A0A9J6P3G8_9CLOT|nr:ribosomal protein L7/L12 [Oceanirhabdus seepicola]